MLKTSIGNFGGQVPDGRDAGLRHCATMDQARGMVPGLRRPAYLPEGYRFYKARITPTDDAFLFFFGPEEDIILYQARVTGQERVGTSSSSPVESVTLKGRPAAWVPGHGLIWEADGVSCTLGGRSLSLDQAVRIAESLE